MIATTKCGCESVGRWTTPLESEQRAQRARSSADDVQVCVGFDKFRDFSGVAFRFLKQSRFSPEHSEVGQKIDPSGPAVERPDHTSQLLRALLYLPST